MLDESLTLLMGEHSPSLGAAQMRTLKIWHEENCYLKHIVCRGSKALQLNMFHLLESIPCLHTGKEFWSTVNARTTMTLSLPNWGEECIVCNYWGPSLEKLEDLSRSGWICLNCKLEKEYLDDLEDTNPHDPLGLGYLKCNELTFSAVLAMPITKVQRLSKQYAKVIADLMSDQFPLWDLTSKTFLKKDKPVRILSKVKDVKSTFQKYKGLNLPINAEVLRDLFRELESEFNVRFSSTNPVRSISSRHQSYSFCDHDALYECIAKTA